MGDSVTKDVLFIVNGERTGSGFLKRILNLMKANMIVKGERTIPDSECDVHELTQNAILDAELRALADEKALYVLNTSLFCIVDYNPTRFFSSVSMDTEVSEH